eukprot:GDKJ01002209.1.p1 GENE.GDKJ01002209.1~~GDKJ01002209.1.p1  ORF type:complete len:124 (-),score=10.64 GDKJ01002209.1:33-377(-)
MSQVNPSTYDMHKSSLVNSASIQHNLKGLMHCRVASGIIAGIVAGMFSFTSLSGIAVFTICNILMSFVLTVMNGPDPARSMLKGQHFFTQSLLSGMMAFILAWLLSYDIVNIFA